jgi:hypothetical protein
MTNNSIKTGNIQGTGIAVGTGATASVKLQQSRTREELTDLLKQLRTEIEKAEIPDGAKRVLLRGPLAEMEEAARTAEPAGIVNGIKLVNDTIESVGSTADKVSGLANNVRKIAGAAGVAYNTVAPFLSNLL